MILFMDDWNRYPEAIVDINTTNKTFLRLAGLYKSMGVKNHAFILALHNPSLVGVDPFSPNLTSHQHQLIGAEVAINPWYYFREVARVPPQSGTESNPLIANRGNIAIFWLFFNHITQLDIQPRQTGKSVNVDVLMAGLLNFWCDSTTVNMLTKDDELRITAVSRLKKVMDELPWYLKFRTKKDSNNLKGIDISLRSNEYRTHVGQSSVKGARKVGRGMTSPIAVIDEGPFISNINYTLSTMLASGGAVRDEAREKGMPFGNIFTTTAGFRDTVSGKFMFEVYKSGMPWTETLFDCEDEETLVNIVNKSSGDLTDMVIMEMNHRQLGKTDDWLRTKIRDAMSSGDDVKADFLNIWPDGSAESPFDKELIEMIVKSEEEVKYTEITSYGYVLRWYVNEREIEGLINEGLVMGLDTSDAIGKDDISLVIKKVKTGENVAVGEFNETNTIVFSQWIASILLKFNKIVLIPERRSTATTIIDNLILILKSNGADPFKKIFNWVVNDASVQSLRYNAIDRGMERRDEAIYDAYRKHFGFATSGAGRTSRTDLYGNTLLSAMKYTGSVIKDTPLIRQLTGLTVKNGRIDHQTSGKDDTVIAWLLTHWFLLNAKNIGFYGFSSNDFLSDVVIADDSIKEDIEREEKLKEQKKLKKEIEYMMELLKNEKDEIRSIVYVNKIRQRYREIDSSFVQNFNLDSMLKEIEITKNKANRFNRY